MPAQGSDSRRPSYASNFSGDSILSYNSSLSTPATSVASSVSSPMSPVMSTDSSMYSTMGQQPNRTFPTHILGLLTALESDPTSAAAALKAQDVPSLFAASSGKTDRPVETEAIHAALARLADRLSRAESASSTNRPHIGRRNSSGTSQSSLVSPSPVLSSRAFSGLMGINDSSSVSTESTIAEDRDGEESGSPTFASGPSAEEELGQLRAQVQDFARVCKVRIELCILLCSFL